MAMPGCGASRPHSTRVSQALKPSASCTINRVEQHERGTAKLLHLRIFAEHAHHRPQQDEGHHGGADDVRQQFDAVMAEGGSEN